ncbi:MAG: hypothetical protein RL033_1501 [Pseudomonadota bacterium]
MSRRIGPCALARPLRSGAGGLGLLLLTAAAQATESPAPATTSAEARPTSSATPETEPGSVALRLTLGLGGGSAGIAARIGAEVDYWPATHVGLGVLGALTGQSALLGDSFHQWLLAPALLVSSESHGRGLFGSAGVGYTTGAYTDASGGLFSCDPCSTRHEFEVPGVLLSGGWVGHTGNVDMGAALVLDLLTIDADGDGDGERAIQTVTVNLTVSFFGG